MADEEKTTENQGSERTDGGKLIGGKFKTPDELLAAYESAEKERNDLKEALDREQRLNQLLDSVKDEPAPATTTAPVSDWTGVFEDEDKAKAFEQRLDLREQSIWQRVDRLVEKRVRDLEVKREATNKFYELYPELKGFEREVDSNAMSLGQELGTKSRNVPFEKLAEEVASRTKKQLAETKRKLTKSALHVESGSMSEPESRPKDEKPGETSEEARAKRYFETEVVALNEKRSRGLHG